MRVASLYRYPVKSMLGEAVSTGEVDQDGIAGDRRFAVIERETGLVASAKQPRKWGRLLQCRAAHDDGGVAISLPEGRVVRSAEDDADVVLSGYCERPVTLSSVPPAAPKLERWWPDVEGLAPADAVRRAGTVTDMAKAAPATFFDYAPIHVVTTSSLDALRRSAPQADFSPARFRPNIVLETDEDGFAENRWAGRLLRLGEVVLEVLTVTPRCAVPAVAHGDLPGNPDVLRAVVANNRVTMSGGRYACVGVYARVVQGGSVSIGDVALNES